LVYSGTISHARGIDTLVRGLAYLPDAHLVIVCVPYPHPSVPALLAIASELGASDRIHIVPPVDQSHLVHYLSGADVAVHPLPCGSPTHDQALPNKLFEYTHAGLPMVVSDARLMADFVTRNNVGEVFVAGDPRSFSDAVAKVLGSPAPDAERMAALAKEFSWQGQEQGDRRLLQRPHGPPGIRPGRWGVPVPGDHRRGRDLTVPAQPTPTPPKV